MNDRERTLTNTFVALADTLVRDFDLTDLLHTLAATCVDVLDASTAGILLAGPSGTLQVVASSDERMRLLELFELQNEQGPCTDCYRSGEAVREPDLRQSDRWPLFTARAIEEGFGSVDAIPLRLRDHRLGALNLFNEAPGGLPGDDRRVAQALADVAAIGLLQERALRESQLLAEQGELSVGDAFEHLRRHARATSTRASVVAAQVVRGELTIGDLR